MPSHHTSDQSDSPAALDESDVRRMVRTLAELSGLDSNLDEKRAHLLEDIANHIGADCYYWALLGQSEAGKLPTFTVYLKGGFTENQFAKYLSAQEHPDMKMLNAPLLKELGEKGAHITRLRQQIDPEGIFPSTEVYQLWKDADLAPLIISVRPNSDGQVSAIAFFRRFDRPLFDERENRIAHIMLSEVPWLHDKAWSAHPRAKMETLSPRLHTVTNLLFQGWQRKKIAEEIDISLHTLNGYVKEIYTYFDVHSQSELIRHFMNGDGGDRN